MAGEAALMAFARKDPRYEREYLALCKESVVNMYTSGEATCRWCGQGDIDVLSVDHIANNGAAHRYPCGAKMTGYKLYQWLRARDYPSGYQILCMNCNLKKELLRKRAVAAFKYSILPHYNN